MSKQRSNLRAPPLLIALLWGSAACRTDSPTPTALVSESSAEVQLSSGGSTCAPCLFGPVTLVRAAGAPDTTWEFAFPSVPGADYIAEVVGRTGPRGAVALNGATLMSDDSFRRDSLAVTLTRSTVLRVTLGGQRETSVRFQLEPVKPVTLDSVSFASAPTLYIDGPGVAFDAAISNRTATARSDLDIQAWIRQTGAYRAAGGQVLYCGSAFGVLQPGECLRAGNGLSASNSGAGNGTLIPGPALAIIQLRRQSVDGTRVLDSLVVPVTLLGSQVLSVSVLPPDLILPSPGNQQQLVASVNAIGGAPTSVMWASSSPWHAVVNSTGVVTGISRGGALVTATSLFDPSRSGTSLISVGTTPFYGVGLNVSPGNWEMNAGDQITIAAQVVADTGRVQWYSSNPTVATAYSTGMVVANARGAALITGSVASAPWKQATSLISVGVTPVPGLGMIVSPGLLELSVGETYVHAAQILGDTGRVYWVSSNPSVAAVSSFGQATAVSKGAALITAQSMMNPFKKATALYAVGTTAAIGNGVNVAPSFLSLPVGQAVQLAAQLVGDTGSVQWSSNNSAVAWVNAVGHVTAVSPGTAGISAQSRTDPSKSATATINVTDFGFVAPVAPTLVSTGASTPPANPLDVTVSTQACGPSIIPAPPLARVDFAANGLPMGSVVQPAMIDIGLTRCWRWTLLWTPGSGFGTGIQSVTARGYDALDRPVTIGPNTFITITSQ